MSEVRATTKKSTPSATAVGKDPKKPYVVILHNIENRYSSIHRDGLLHYLGLSIKERGTSFRVSIREETHTAEIDFLGNSRTPNEEKKNSNNAEENSLEERGFLRAQKQHKGPVAASSSEKNETEEDIMLVDESTVIPSASPRFSSLHDLVSVFTPRPYFNHPVQFKILEGEGSPAASKQNLFVSTELHTPVATTAKHLRKILLDLVGFLSCWRIRSSPSSQFQKDSGVGHRFRASFESVADLFSAKKLLDQFEAEQGLMVHVILKQALMTEFQEYLQQSDEIEGLKH